MKILHVISAASSGGAELLVKDLSLEITALGHEVGVVFLDEAAAVGRDELFEKKFIAELNDNGVKTFTLGTSCRKNIFKGVYRLKSILKEFSPDLVHCHLFYAAIFSLFTFKKNISFIYTHHNIKLGAPSWLFKLLDFKFSSYIGICKACTDLLLPLTNQKVVHIDNGVSVKKILPKNNYTTGYPVKVLLVGRLTKQKNIQLFVNAVANLKDLDFEAYIAGEGELFGDIEKLIYDLGIEKKLVLLGNVNDVPSLLNKVDLFTLCSSWEGLPISQIEATLTGLPVLVTNVGGCAEIVESVRNGITVAEGDLKSYTEALRNLICDSSLRASYNKNALMYSGKYTLNECVDNHLKLYSEVSRKC